MEKFMKFQYYIVLVLVLPLSGCIADCFLGCGLPPGTLYHPKSDTPVRDCYNNILTKSDAQSRAFWDENNLPHGTINFACRNHKAYLPGNVPEDLKDLPDDRNLRIWTP